MRLCHHVLLGVLLLAGTVCYCQSGEGTITGTVVTEQGEPVGGATIWCSVETRTQDGGSQSVGAGMGLTDAAGKFQIQHLPWNTYTISASKHAEGYQQGFEGSEAILTSDRPSAVVVVKVGPKQAMLVPAAVDKFTREPVFDFRVRWTSDEVSPHSDQSQSGSWGVSRLTKQVLLPPNKSVTIQVTKPGYRSWWYMDPSQPNGPGIMRLQPGERRDLTIELEPASETPQ